MSNGCAHAVQKVLQVQNPQGQLYTPSPMSIVHLILRFTKFRKEHLLISSRTRKPSSSMDDEILNLKSKARGFLRGSSMREAVLKCADGHR